METTDQLKRFEDRYRGEIDQYLNDYLPIDIDQDELNSAMNYSVSAGGKRLRPLLTIAVLSLYQVPIDPNHLRATTALELLHTYSLIHDDLPAMDNDDLRRGMPTNHIKFGPGMATLAGDGLLTLAFQWLVDNRLADKIKLQLVLALSKASGPSGMVAGQADDIQFEGEQLSLDQLRVLHRHKTGDLIHYAIQAGLIMSNAHKQDQAPLLKFADAYGLAFQIYDDILDVVGDQSQLGKPVHQDQDKNTYPNLVGLDRSYQLLSDVIDQGKQSLDQFEQISGKDASLLRAFFSYFEIK